MKKMMMMALMVLATTSVFAGDSPALKAVMSAKTYAEAEAALKANLSQMLNDAERAKAYNKLVDLAMDKVMKEDNAKSMAEIAVNAKDAPTVDYVGYYDAIYDAVVNAIECEKYDALPNEKGQVKPKFRKKNDDRLYPRRSELINAGVYYQEKEDNDKAFKFLDMYVDSASEPLFAAHDVNADENLSNIAFYSAYNALQKEDYPRAERLSEMALTDSVNGENAYIVKVSAMQKQLVSHQDSINYAQKLETLYKQDPSRAFVFESLCGIYSALDNKAALNTLIADRLAVDPKDWAAHAYRGQIYQSEEKYDEAIADFEAAKEVDATNAFIEAALGISYMGKAGQYENENQDASGNLSKDVAAARDEILKTAISHFEAARKLDKNEDYRSSWGHNLYRCYYIVYGEDDPRTQEMSSY